MLDGRDAAARPGLQHRLLELPDERAGPRRCWCRLLAGNAVIAKTPTDGGLSPASPWRTRSAPREGLPVTLVSGGGARAVRGAGPRRPRSAASGLRRRPRHRRQGRHRRSPTPTSATSSSRRASTPGASGTSPTGTRSPAHLKQGLRVRQAALHRVPALRRPARAVRRVPRGLPARWSVACAFGHPLAVDDRRRPAARPGLRPADQRGQGEGTARPGRPRRSPAARCRCYRGKLDDGRFLPGQDTSAYLAAGRAAGPAAGPRRCTTRSRSARSTRSSWSTPRRSCWPR